MPTADRRSVVIDPETWDQLEELARAHGRNRSAELRTLIRAAYEAWLDLPDELRS